MPTLNAKGGSICAKHQYTQTSFFFFFYLSSSLKALTDELI